MKYVPNMPSKSWMSDKSNFFTPRIVKAEYRARMRMLEKKNSTDTSCVNNLDESPYIGTRERFFLPRRSLLSFVNLRSRPRLSTFIFKITSLTDAVRCDARTRREPNGVVGGRRGP